MQKISRTNPKRTGKLLNTVANIETVPVKYDSGIQSRWVICVHWLLKKIARARCKVGENYFQLPKMVCLSLCTRCLHCILSNPHPCGISCATAGLTERMVIRTSLKSSGKKLHSCRAFVVWACQSSEDPFPRTGPHHIKLYFVLLYFLHFHGMNLNDKLLQYPHYCYEWFD